MIVIVTRDDLEPQMPMSSVWTVTGLDEEGHRVRFGGDHRPMRELFERVLAEGEVQAFIEDWQVLGRIYDPDMTAELDRQQVQDPPDYAPDEEPPASWTGYPEGGVMI